jgi:hypothetical protein
MAAIAASCHNPQELPEFSSRLAFSGGSQSRGRFYEPPLNEVKPRERRPIVSAL